jgi:ABC-type Fe3+ transport system substrate-binding protein
MRKGPAAAAAAILCLLAAGAVAAELPAATKRQLQAMKLDAAILAGLDEELVVPEAWKEAAKSEPAAQILVTWSPEQFKKITEAFRQRFPMAKIEGVRSSRDARTTQPLVAFKQGKYVADVISNFTQTYDEMKAAGAFEDLRVIPNFKQLAPGMSDPEGSWVAGKTTYWCMSYNRDQVTPRDLPNSWDDYLTNPFWRSHLALTNSVAGWLPPLWQAKGDAWGRDFMQRLFSQVKPQQRIEGRDASTQLVASGELASVMPAGDYRVRQLAGLGAPVGFHCPDLVPLAPAQMAILKGSPAPNAAKLFLNWYLSKEGQLAMHVETGDGPVHKDFQRAEFAAYPEIVFSKDRKIVVDSLDRRIIAEADSLWNKGWNHELPAR